MTDFDISTADLLLMCGEMSARELRTVRAVLGGLKARAARRVAETQRSSHTAGSDEKESGAQPKERSTAREAFEKWADSEGYKNLARHNEGRGAYDDDEVLTLWVGWRAALSHRSRPEAWSNLRAAVEALPSLATQLADSVWRDEVLKLIDQSDQTSAESPKAADGGRE